MTDTVAAVMRADSPRAARRVSPRWHWVVLLALLPAWLSVTLPDWVYSQSDYIDAWVYHGFFRHLETYAADMFPETYYGSRLGWIVPGYIAYHVFSPGVATIVLHLTFYSIAVASLYVIVRRASSASSALFAAVAFGLYLPTVRSLGSDYVDGAVITYGLAAVALGVHGIDRSRRWAVIASGAAAAAMVHSNIGAVLVVPSILVWFLPSRRQRWLDPLLMRNALHWGLGIVACTLALSVVSVLAGAGWAFFMQSVRWVQQYRLQNPWNVTGLSWVGQSPWLFLPLATLLAAVVVWLRRRDQMTPGQVKAIGSLGLLIGIFALWDFVGTGSILYWPFYASWLVPWTFVVIGAVLVPSLARLDMDAITVLISSLVLGGSLAWLHRRIPGFGFTGLGVTIGLILAAGLVRRAIESRLLIAAAIACVHSWMALTNLYLPGGDRRDAFHVIDRGIRVIERYVTDIQPRFLLTPPKRLGHYVQGLTSVYLWGYTIASDRFPIVTPAQAALITPGVMVIVISEQPDAAKPFDEVFRPFNLSGVVRGSERVDTEHGPLYLTFLQAKVRAAS